MGSIVEPGEPKRAGATQFGAAQVGGTSTAPASWNGQPRRPAGIVRAFDRAVAAAARWVGWLSRTAHLGAGTTLPGRLARAVDPGFVSRRGATLPEGSVLVSGTNGKTTTASMLQTILGEEGMSLVANRSGANLASGVASALAFAPADARIGVFEVDEAVLPSMVEELRPRLLVVTNIFRDQLDRFPEPDRVATLVRQAAEGLPAGARIVANGDDPLLWAALEDLYPIGFSLAAEATDVDDGAADGEPEICFRCGSGLRFLRRTMASLGAAMCSVCGWVSPDVGYVATLADRAGLSASVFEIGDEIVTLPLGGIHNAYNAVAAIAAASELGVHPARAISALESFRPRFGRAEELFFEAQHLWLGLIKNPAGAGAVIREVCSDRRVGAVVVAVSDREADGRDVSWIWDADFERLASLKVPIVAAGTRAADAAVRMKYAGSPPRAVEVRPVDAVRAAAGWCPPQGLVAVVATYTAMLDVRRALTGDRAGRVEDRAS